MEGLAPVPVRVYGRYSFEQDRNIAGIGENGHRGALGVDAELCSSTTLSLEGNAYGKSAQEEYGASLNLNIAF